MTRHTVCTIEDINTGPKFQGSICAVCLKLQTYSCMITCTMCFQPQVGCEAAKLVKVSACLQPLFEIDNLNATGAFSRLPAYRDMLFVDEFHHFLNHFDVFLTFMVDSLKHEMAQPHFYQDYIQKRATAGQQSCTQGAQSQQAARALPEHHRLLAMDDLKTIKAEPNKLIWRTFTTEGSKGESPAATHRVTSKGLRSCLLPCELEAPLCPGDLTAVLHMHVLNGIMSSTLQLQQQLWRPPNPRVQGVCLERNWVCTD